jgi:hypothetical protein
MQMMHCTLCTEGVREIVSAEGSEVKFIAHRSTVRSVKAVHLAVGPI